jgi:hypothetical protein
VESVGARLTTVPDAVYNSDVVIVAVAKEFYKVHFFYFFLWGQRPLVPLILGPPFFSDHSFLVHHNRRSSEFSIATSNRNYHDKF